MAHAAVGMRAWLRCGPGRKGMEAGWLGGRRLCTSRTSCSLVTRKSLQTLEPIIFPWLEMIARDLNLSVIGIAGERGLRQLY